MSGSEPTVTASRSCFLDLGDEGKMSAVGKAPCVCLRPSLFFSTRRAHAAIVEIQCQLIPFLHARHVVSVIQRNKRKKVGRNEVLDPGTRRGGRKRRSASFDRSTSKASTKKPARRTPREERERGVRLKRGHWWSQRRLHQLLDWCWIEATGGVNAAIGPGSFLTSHRADPGLYR